jgi:hypothetical protein
MSVVTGLQHLTALQISGKGLGGWSDPMQLRLLPASLEVLVVLGRDSFWANMGPVYRGLGHLTRLRQLRLGGLVPYDVQVNDPAAIAAAAQQHLAGLTRLTALECEAALTSNRALLQLPSLVAVGTLAGHPDEAAMAALRQLQGRPSLRRLTLAEPEEALVDMGRLTQLEELTITGDGSCGGAGFVSAAKRHSLWCA